MRGAGGGGDTLSIVRMTTQRYLPSQSALRGVQEDVQRSRSLWRRAGGLNSGMDAWGAFSCRLDTKGMLLIYTKRSEYTANARATAR